LRLPTIFWLHDRIASIGRIEKSIPDETARLLGVRFSQSKCWSKPLRSLRGMLNFAATCCPWCAYAPYYLNHSIHTPVIETEILPYRSGQVKIQWVTIVINSEHQGYHQMLQEQLPSVSNVFSPE
jgi:hypothetical protein